MRPTAVCAATPVDLVQLAPSFVEYQTWPLSVRCESVTASASDNTKPWPPVDAIVQMYGPVARPVAIGTWLHDVPELVERYRPWSVAASTIDGAVGSTR